MKKFLTLAIAGLMAIGLTACGKTQVNPNAGPKWVNSRTYLQKEFGKGFYTVGTSTGTQNVTQQRVSCDRNARDQMAALLNTYVTSLNKQYIASTTAGDGSAISDEQHLEYALKAFVQEQVKTADAIEWHYEKGTNKGNGVQYCLLKLDLASSIEKLSKVKELDAKMRDYIKQNAEKSFDDLDAEAAKH